MPYTVRPDRQLSIAAAVSAGEMQDDADDLDAVRFVGGRDRRAGTDRATRPRDAIAAAWFGVCAGSSVARPCNPMKLGQSRFDDLFASDFGTLVQLVAAHARERPRHLALIHDDATVDYRELDWRADRVAASLLRDGIGKGDVAAICAASSIDYVVAYLGALRAGAAVSPLAPSSTARSLATMIEDCGAKMLFLDHATSETLGPVARTVHAKRVSLDGSSHAIPLEDWFCPEWMRPAPVGIAPDDPFDIIYPSGATIGPKRVVRPHAMRWYQFKQPVYGSDAVTMVSMPLHSEMALAGLLSTLASGGTIVLMASFDAGEFLRNAELQRATHAMLIPEQYLRITTRPDFVMRAQDRSATEIFGEPDDMKFRSSMTLFAQASPRDVFVTALTAFFGGEADPATIALLA